jgi:hypothetical protein
MHFWEITALSSVNFPVPDQLPFKAVAYLNIKSSAQHISHIYMIQMRSLNVTWSMYLHYTIPDLCTLSFFFSFFFPAWLPFLLRFSVLYDSNLCTFCRGSSSVHSHLWQDYLCSHKFQETVRRRKM